MKQPDDFLLNTTTPTGRSLGAAKNNPGDNSGSGMDKEIYNDTVYGHLAMIESYKEGGNSGADETLLASDMRDAIEEMNGMKVTDPVTTANSVSDWDVATSYTTVGEAVMQHGMQYVAWNITGNVGKDPSDKAGRAYWRKVPSLNKLMDLWDSGEVLSMGLNPMSDRSDGNYRQNIDFGRFRVGGNGETFKQFSLVHLDGSVVTGDTDLEAIFDPDGSDEYWNIDMIAPDSLGTRTLIDMGGRVIECQTNSGFVDTMGEVHDDYMQRITGAFGQRGSNTGFQLDTGVSGVFAIGSSEYSLVSATASASAGKMEFDSADSTSPNTAKTDDDRTAHAALVGAISAIIVANDL